MDTCFLLNIAVSGALSTVAASAAEVSEPVADGASSSGSHASNQLSVTASAAAKPAQLAPIRWVRNAVGPLFSDDGPMISTDRNSVTPHPNAVPFGYIQVENGMTLSKLHRGGDMGLPESITRIGTWKQGELRFQVPNYFKSWGFDGRKEGTADIQIGIKQEFETEWLRRKGFDFGTIVGISLPTGTRYLGTRNVDPFVQMVAFQKLGQKHILGTSHSIFMPSPTPATSDEIVIGGRKVTYQPTVILFRSIGDRIDVWGEWAAQVFERDPSVQIMDFGAVWRPRKRHQVDFRFGVGMTNPSPRAFIGFGYSFLTGPWFSTR